MAGKLLEGRLPAGPINTVDMALSDPQILARNMVVETTHRSGEKMNFLGTPIKMSPAAEPGSSTRPRPWESTPSNPATPPESQPGRDQAA